MDEDQTVTSFYALSTHIAPAPVMLRLGNSTIDSTKSFKVPQPSQEPPQRGPPGAANEISVPKVISTPTLL